MKVITFSLQTQQPLLATSFQGDPNSDVSYSYIPGSMIRGAIIGRYMKQHRCLELDLSKDEIKRLFFDANSTCYLNAYLQSNQGNRTLPIPYSWFKEKNTELTDESALSVYDLSFNNTDELENLKFVGEGFWHKEGGLISYYTEKRRINIHNQRDRQKGRSRKIKRNQETQQVQGEGEIFRYEAIDKGQTFQGVILCHHDADVQTIINLLQESQDIWLGGSRSAGYGHNKIISVSKPMDLDNWNEVNVSVEEDDRTDRDYLTVTLLSDLILRDKWGQYSLIPPSTQQEISVPLIGELKKFFGGNLKPKLCFTSSTLIGGFNRKWGLPLPTVTAFKAGSVFVFNVEDASVTKEQIQEIEIQGIGERKHEGFGRIAINWLAEEEDFSLRLPNKKTKNENFKPLKNDSRDLARQMAERLLNKKIETKVKQYLGRIKIKGEISNNQLRRLQLIARQAVATGECERVLLLLEALPKNANSQFEKAIIFPSNNNESLKQTLKSWLENPGVWMSNKQDLKVKVGDVERSFNDEFSKKNRLAEKSTLSLIMALARKATKEVNS